MWIFGERAKPWATSHTIDSKLLAKPMRSYPWANDLNARTCALERCELFRSTKTKLDLPPRPKYDSHRLDKVNYSIHAPTQDPLRQALKSLSHMMKMRCSIPPTYQSQGAWNTSNTFLDCLVNWRKSARFCRPTHGIQSRPKQARVNMARLCQLTKV